MCNNFESIQIENMLWSGTFWANLVAVLMKLFLLNCLNLGKQFSRRRC